MVRRRYRPPADDAPGPAWLLRLRLALMPFFPTVEEPWNAPDGTQYCCYRHVLDTGDRLLFTEYWLDLLTHDVSFQWQVEIEAGAFAGYVPDSVFAQHVTVLVHGLLAHREQVTQPPACAQSFFPTRFARHQGHSDIPYVY